MVLMKKLTSLDESKWNEQIKCFNELSDVAMKHSEVLNECDPLVLINTVRTICTLASSSKSNVSKYAVLCLGHLFQSYGSVLTPILSDALSILIKKASSGSPEFLTTAANETLLKVCKSASETKLTTFLLHQNKIQKSTQLTVLNCFVLLFNKMGESLAKLKSLPEVIDVVAKGLSAGNQSIRTSARVLAGIANCHFNLSKLRLADNVKRNITLALSKYKEEEKDALIEKLESGHW